MTHDAPPANRPSLADVGRLADVSAQTVSRYYTGRGYVSAATRQRIEAAIGELGYRPNHAARNLRVGRSQTIGVLAIGQILYGTAAILTGLAARAHDEGYALMITQLDLDIESPEAPAEVRRAIDGFLSARVDGLVVTTPYLDTEHLLEDVWDSFPIVTMSGRPRDRFDSSTIDNRLAGLIATRHLISLGHRRIVHVAGPENRNEAHERERGYREAMAEAGLDPLPVVRGDWSAASGHAAGVAVDPTTFTAVFSGNDQMALGFLAAMRERGRHCPADFSIVGVDDMPDARYFDPPLSSVWMDFTGSGETAISMLCHRLTTGERTPLRMLEPVLVPRASSAPTDAP